MNLSWWISYAWVQFLVLRLCTSQDTISINQLFRDGDVLISNGGNFALGFFSPGKSNYRYVGIWCHKVPERSIVWVANRDNPINDTSGFLAIDTHGNLVILYENNDQKVQLWSTNASVSPTNNSVARLLDSGNLVLFPKQSNKLLWQSFDDPTNTMISYMKLGIDRRTGLKRFLTSWKSEDDPGTGNYTYTIDPNGSPQIFLYKGRVPWWRSGHWNGIRWSGVPIMQGNSLINASFVNNNNEMSYMWSVYNTSILSRIVLDESGSVQRFMWFEQERGWNEIWSAPVDQCDKYGHCSTFGLCDPYNATEFECTCLPGFEPKSPSEWYFRDARHGCVRKPGSLICRKGDGFVKIENVKVPDTSKVQVISSLSLKACEQDCLRDCNCIAYASADISEGGSGCITWHENLIDTRKLTVGGQDFYIRVDEPELAQYAKKSKGVATKGIRAIMAVFGILILFGISFFAYWFVKRKRKGETLLDVNISEESLKEKKLGESRRQTDLQLFDIRTLITATDNFSATNKLGEGGFGSVFKGHLVDGQEIAVKRLSKHSGQGLEEFKNEVMVIAKLQHRNLVRLLGCCIHKEEKMLIYEYLPNKSLDYFIYDVTRRSCLDWNKRFEIVKGIARGILYLHHDSRLKVIHRDLKASNILLDAAMNPKISDFGVAKMFGEDQIKANTKRVVGTYGYMSPEYAMHGVYSTKSDVYSFGVLLLEIISGRKNTDFVDGSHLIGHVWELWKEERKLDTVDPTIVIRPLLEEEVSRCIHVGLLCVQEGAIERPTMSSVVFMLANETTLPPPNTPAFILQQKCFDAELSTSRSGGGVSLNSVTITMLEAR